MKITVKIVDRDNFLKGADNLVEKMDRIASDVLLTSALMIEGKAKEYAPVDRGILRGSITHSRVDKSLGSYRISVGTNVKYAPYQEYGTGIYVGRGYITPKRARFLTWRDRQTGQWIFAKKVRGVKGKKYFGKAVKYFLDNFRKVFNTLKVEIEKYV